MVIKYLLIGLLLGLMEMELYRRLPVFFRKISKESIDGYNAGVKKHGKRVILSLIMFFNVFCWPLNLLSFCLRIFRYYVNKMK